MLIRKMNLYPKVKPAVRKSDMLIKWLSPGIDRVTVQEAERTRCWGNGREGDDCRNEATSNQYSCFCISFQLHSSCRNFFPCSYYPSTFELSWLYNEISSWDKICHCGAILPIGSVEAANSLQLLISLFLLGPSWNLSRISHLFEVKT